MNRKELEKDIANYAGELENGNNDNYENWIFYRGYLQAMKDFNKGGK